MPRDRQRLTLESGPVLDLAEIIRRGAGRAGARIRAVYSFSKGEVLATELSLDEHGGTMELAFDGRRQSFKLASQSRHFGGRQWYIICPSTSRRVRVLYRPLGAPWFGAGMHGADEERRMRHSFSVPWIEHGAPKQS